MEKSDAKVIKDRWDRGLGFRFVGDDGGGVESGNRILEIDPVEQQSGGFRSLFGAISEQEFRHTGTQQTARLESAAFSHVKAAAAPDSTAVAASARRGKLR